MHVWTHLKPASEGKTKLEVYPDGMVELDGLVGQLLKKLDDLGVADNTIVVFTSDNGAEVMSWPDGGTTPFRGEKATNWEGAFRVPTVIRWPGTIGPGTVGNEMCSHYDLIRPCDGGGDPSSVDKCRRSAQVGTRHSRSISTASISFPSSGVLRRNCRARSSFTGTRTANSVALRVDDGSACSLSRITRASA